MTVKEKDKLVELVTKVLEFTEILSPDSADALYNIVLKTDDKYILDVLIRHMEEIKIYVTYFRFDKEASVRDIENLLNIISNAGGK